MNSLGLHVCAFGYCMSVTDVWISLVSLDSLLSPVVAVDEESEADNGTKLWNGFDKLGEMEAHLIRHRELFLSRQIETYKIDMVR